MRFTISEPQEEGVTFEVLGCPQKLYGTVAAIAADNLASNALGGFKEGSTANRGCRQCMATPDEISTKVCQYLRATFFVGTGSDD